MLPPTKGHLRRKPERIGRDDVGSNDLADFGCFYTTVYTTCKGVAFYRIDHVSKCM